MQITSEWLEENGAYGIISMFFDERDEADSLVLLGELVSAPVEVNGDELSDELRFQIADWMLNRLLPEEVMKKYWIYSSQVAANMFPKTQERPHWLPTAEAISESGNGLLPTINKVNLGAPDGFEWGDNRGVVIVETVYKSCKGISEEVYRQGLQQTIQYGIGLLTRGTCL